MRFNFGTNILNSEEEKVAELDQVVIDPKTDEVTALIAKKGFLFPKDKVIPISLVMNSTDDYIKLYDFEGSFDDLEDFTETHFVKAETGRKNSMYSSLPPLIAYPSLKAAGGMGYVPRINYPETIKPKTVKNIPEENVDIQENAKVIGLDGDHVGNVKEVLINPVSDRITHFVISKGIFFSEEKLIPVGWVSGFGSDKLKLVVNSNVIEQLPEHVG